MTRTERVKTACKDTEHPLMRGAKKFASIHLDSISKLPEEEQEKWAKSALETQSGLMYEEEREYPEVVLLEFILRKNTAEFMNHPLLLSQFLPGVKDVPLCARMGAILAQGIRAVDLGEAYELIYGD